MSKAIPTIFVAVCAAFVVFASAQQPTSPEPPVKVFIAASGAAEQLPAILDGLTDCLTAKGVHAKQLSAAAMSRGVALDELKQKPGAPYLLFASLDFAPGKQSHGTLTIQSFDRSGKAIWEEKIKGGFLMTSQSGYIQKMIKNACEKLEAHIGNEGLPKD